jgi:FMN phosphatase YigB (HAD superfamily)
MTNTILPHELPEALGRCAEMPKVLSLDCFDTLLWRDCHAPTDLFAGLDDLTIKQRAVAETRARKIEKVQRARSEVGLGAIYAQAMPGADERARSDALAAELALEARTCFAFAPTVELMRAANSAGLKVIIVSDTYLDGDQLIELIEQAAGAEVAALIDRVFASSEYGVSKSQGLLGKVLGAMKCAGSEVLHIGDNRVADFESARALGIRALHLAQFPQTAERRQRLEAASQQLVNRSGEGVRGLMPHRAVIAHEEPSIEDRAQNLGFTVLGPIFHAFDTWLRREAEALQAARGGTVHWLFMLRDGHLPHRVHQEGGAAQSTARVEISRFTAIAASLTSRSVYKEQMALEFGLNPPTLARQFLFDEEEIARIVGEPKTQAEMVEASHALLAELRKGQREKLTRRRARGRAERLVAHVKRACDPKPGDTLMLVDLGYNGSAQDRIDALLAEELGVHVAGRYLLLREMAASGFDKKGLLDDRHFDPEVLDALCSNIAVIEQLATSEMGSVVDYTEEGEPVRVQSMVKGAQSAVRDRVQAGASRFAEVAARAPVIRTHAGEAERGWRSAAAGVLTRFLFLPQAEELAVLESFEHDVNLGSERMVALFDPVHAREGMRRRGLFYMRGASRMFLPAEIEGEDLASKLSLMVQKCFGLGLSYTDGAPAAIEIPAFFVNGEESVRATIKAEPTHEGFYCARLPVSAAAQSIALIVGSTMEWFELHGITHSPMQSFKDASGENAEAKPLAAKFDGIKERAPGILECTTPEAFILVAPPASADTSEAHMIEIVIRPLRLRDQGSGEGLQPASAAAQVAA